MNSTAVKITAAVLVVVAIILAVIAYQTSKGLSRPPPDIVVAPSQTQTESGTRGVIAVKPIRAYQPIKAEDVDILPLAVVPLHYFQDPSSVIGRAPITDIDVGVPLTGRYFGNVSVLAQSIPPGHKAIALRIDEVIAVGNFVQPGDIVDVLVYVRGGGAGAETAATPTETQSRILLRAVRVLAFEERVLLQPVSKASDEEEEDKNRRNQTAAGRIQTVVVAVPEEDTTRVMLGASLGELRLALHSAPEREPEATDDGFFGEEPPGSGLAALVPGAEIEDEQVITLRELTALQGRQAAPAPRAPTLAAAAVKKEEQPSAIVHRGGETVKVSRDGVVLK